MRAIKAAVVVMTLLIFAALGLLAHDFLSGPSARAAAAASALPMDAPPKDLALPAKATIRMMSPWKNGLALDVTTPEGEYIYFIDPATQQQTHITVTRGK
jgi:hypothetical protein